MTEALSIRYQRFAATEARGRSPLYEALALGVANDGAILTLLAALPLEKQQPNLLFAAVRVVAGTAAGFSDFRNRLLSHANAVCSLMLRRRTQTNEPNRCAVLLPLLARLPGPLALIEVGASAGLCLLPDRYGYDYGSVTLPGMPVLHCRAQAPLPYRKPEVAWRIGLDLDPVDLADPAEVAWLEALVWPDQPERLSRLRQAMTAACADPPSVVPGDLRVDTIRLVAEARQYGTPVVFHTAVLAYLPDAAERVEFGRLVMEAGAVWISNEAPAVFPAIARRVGSPAPDRAFLMAQDGVPVAWTNPHGSWITWIA
ncbi:DUF2332 domain-containing protein [Rhodopila sp.]|uniref:DUF2332 domain-containing protein n=1 Tax=Rhodopila sp. TaxID=2480087 RepID=UPI003D1184F5